MPPPSSPVGRMASRDLNVPARMDAVMDAAGAHADMRVPAARAHRDPLLLACGGCFRTATATAGAAAAPNR